MTTNYDQQACEIAERCAHLALNELELFSYLPPDIGANAVIIAHNAILRELNLASLLEDKARLDWLEKHAPIAIWNGTFADSDLNISLGRVGAPIATVSTMDESGCEADREIGRGDSVRTAITQAMKEDKPS